LTIPSPKVGLVQLTNIAQLEPARGPTQIDRFGRQRQVLVYANLDGVSLSEAVDKVKQQIESLGLPPQYTYEFLGEAKLLAETNSNFLIAFTLAFIFMYMILAAQFESLVHPITILLSLPLTLPFALLSLLMLNSSLDIYATIGLFMLFGIVKKNGILQVDYTNVLRERGMSVYHAIIEANETRLRPILMTTLMLVAAMIPIALGQGPGASSRASMAKVILGGQLLSLLLSLLVVPVAYSLWTDFEAWFKRTRLRLQGKTSQPPPTEVVPGDRPLVAVAPRS
jgi:HAE1 family hydrophobic/amphiphilic exporter-1